jgi:acetyl/propionyl-CoA carboxylase alpha subunit
MHDDINFEEIINKYRSDPYDYQDIVTPHTGSVKFKVVEGQEVEGSRGKWNHHPGTLLYVLNRENNPKTMNSPTNGVVASLRDELEGDFVEAGEKLMTIKHPLKKREIIEGILQNVLYLFRAPEKAKYFFSLDVQARIEMQGEKAVFIKPGEEIITMSLMKRDTPIYYTGEEGIIHSVYFKPGVSVKQGEPLIGVCAREKLPLIQKIITHVKAEWS